MNRFLRMTAVVLAAAFAFLLAGCGGSSASTSFTWFVDNIPANLDPQVATKAEDVIRKADKQRASYYDYYATATWGAVDNYDLCVDTGAVGVDGAVDVIAQFVELQEKFRQEKQ